MSKHTPGQWYEHNAGFIQSDVSDDKGIHRTEAVAEVRSTYKQIEASDGSWINDKSVMQADADLIAAAPELLIACSAAMRWVSASIGEEAERRRLFDMLDAAISKAEGRPHEGKV